MDFRNNRIKHLFLVLLFSPRKKPGTTKAGVISEAQKQQKDFKVSRKRYIRILKTLYPNFENVTCKHQNVLSEL